MPLWVIALLSGLTRFGSLFTGRQPAVTPEMLDGLRHSEIVNCEKAVRARVRKGPASIMLETALAWQVEEGIVTLAPPARLRLAREIRRIEQRRQKHEHDNPRQDGDDDDGDLPRRIMAARDGARERALLAPTDRANAVGPRGEAVAFAPALACPTSQIASKYRLSSQSVTARSYWRHSQSRVRT